MDSFVQVFCAMHELAGMVLKSTFLADILELCCLFGIWWTPGIADGLVMYFGGYFCGLLDTFQIIRRPSSGCLF